MSINFTTPFGVNRNGFIALLLLLGAAGFWPGKASAQQDEVLHNLFEPLTRQQITPYRTASGAPAHDYWQNETDYDIAVRLDDEQHRISGRVSITYTNNSPNELPFLWLLLEQNLFSQDSKGSRATPVDGGRFGNLDFDGGYEISGVELEYEGRRYEPEYHIRDTRMRVDLAEALSSGGDVITLHIEYAFDIPDYGSDRMGRIELEDGWVYTIAQWYPNMSVYDEVSGWNTRPYLGAGEFYRDFGTIDFRITVPWDMIVGGSGKLQNPEEVLTEVQRRRLDAALESDETMFIIAPDEVGNPETRPVQSGELTWHFRIENARDAAWAASRGFIWDAAGASMLSGRTVAAMSLYPRESAGNEAWGRSTEYTRASIMHYSEKWLEYPYETALNVAGLPGGMEYPGVSFCGYNRGGASLWGVTDHEFGHNWFPMIVGSNERRWMWMDEGLNTFIGHLSTQNFNDGEYQTWIRSMNQFVPNLTNPEIPPVMTHSDRIPPQHLGFLAYFKPAIGMLMLRNYVLGEQMFDDAFSAYIERWAYKHPTPMDLFRTINDVSGENLDWFWRGWFYENRNIDLSVDEVTDLFDDEEAYSGSLITLGSPGDLVMPVELEIEYADGNIARERLPVEIWHRGRQWTFKHESAQPVTRIQIDPDNHLPDIKPSNGVWERPEP